jgi:methionyl-tRNA formyltransferase
MLTGRFKNWLTTTPEYSALRISFTKTIYSATKAGAGTSFINLKSEEEVLRIINDFDLVISLNSAQVFPKKLVTSIKCINIHPGYNPDTRGCFPEIFSLMYNTKIGATIHEMDAELDHGPVIAREAVEKTDWDTADTLYKKIIDKEFELIEKNFDAILKNTYDTISVEEGKLYTKKDFNALLKIDTDEKKTFREFIDYLRAMTFEGYDNCYYVNEEGRKIYVSIRLKPGT